MASILSNSEVWGPTKVAYIKKNTVYLRFRQIFNVIKQLNLVIRSSCKKPKVAYDWFTLIDTSEVDGGKVILILLFSSMLPVRWCAK